LFKLNTKDKSIELVGVSGSQDTLPLTHMITTNKNDFLLSYDKNVLTLFNSTHFKNVDVDTIPQAGTFTKVSFTKDYESILAADNSSKLFKIRADFNSTIKASFYTNDTLIRTMDNVHFINCSFGNADSYFWDFGDGSTSTQVYPVKNFEYSGTYTIN
jgi:PKD repeat protein